MAIASYVTFLVAIFTLHETAYEREKINLDLPETGYGPKKGWLSRLSLTSGYNPEASFFWLVGK